MSASSAHCALVTVRAVAPGDLLLPLKAFMEAFHLQLVHDVPNSQPRFGKVATGCALDATIVS